MRSKLQNENYYIYYPEATQKPPRSYPEAMEMTNAAISHCSTALLISSITTEMTDHQAFLNRTCAPFFMPQYEIDNLAQLRGKAHLRELAPDQIGPIMEVARSRYWAFLPIYDIVLEIVYRYSAYIQALKTARGSGIEKAVLIDRLVRWRSKLDGMLLSCTVRADLIVACDYGLAQTIEPMVVTTKGAAIDMAYNDSDFEDDSDFDFENDFGFENDE